VEDCRSQAVLCVALAECVYLSVCLSASLVDRLFSTDSRQSVSQSVYQSVSQCISQSASGRIIDWSVGQSVSLSVVQSSVRNIILDLALV
jgi:hypothetical protein